MPKVKKPCSEHKFVSMVKPDPEENTLKTKSSIISARKMSLDMKFGLSFFAYERGITTTNKNYLAGPQWPVTGWSQSYDQAGSVRALPYQE